MPILEAALECAMGASAFRQWLAGHDADDIVGLANHVQCPVAAYVSDVLGEHVGYYGEHFELMTGEDAEVEAEKWMQDFSLLLDAEMGDHRVTAARALDLLAKSESFRTLASSDDPSLPSMQELLGRKA
jgi:hypothetical protein